MFSGLERLEDEEVVEEEVVEEEESLEVVGGSREESSAANDTWETAKKQKAVTNLYEVLCGIGSAE